MMDERDLSIRSDEVQEIMSYVPHWIVRWGITVVCFTLVMLLGVSWLIKYPDIVTGQVTIVSSAPPVGVIPRASGKMTLYVADHAAVTAGTVLAVIQNPAAVADVFALKANLQRFATFFADPASASNIVFDRSAALGELQDTYATFLQNLLSYQLIMQHSASSQVATAAEAQYGDDVSKLVHQKVLLTKELEVADKKNTSSKKLFEKGLISEMELAECERVSHEKRTTLDYVNTLALSLQLMYQRLESQLAEWEHTYLLRAPVDGVLSFFEFWSNNQFVTAGAEVMTIVPHAHHLVGRVLLPGAGSGKVLPGQRVHITCDNYPYREYGFVRGSVAAIALAPHNNQYLVRVDLPAGLTTTFGKALEYRQEMSGQAMIVTADLRLIERVFQRLRALFASSTL